MTNPAPTEPLYALYEDEVMLVLDKPAELLSVPGRGADKQDCLSSRAQQIWPDALVVHRLDMATSGLILMARNKAAQRILSDAFAQRAVKKRYQAVVHGTLAPPLEPWGLIELPIAVDWPNRPLRFIDPVAGKASATRWRVLPGDERWRAFATADAATAAPCTRLELEPLTGRSHQLRVHLRALGHPIRGDRLYSDDIANPGSTRLLLHACRLELAHPVTGERLRFDSPCPF
jgi:tRNA pseudouridine32 synthase/23S rRNA pseudouridine746 synthase